MDYVRDNVFLFPVIGYCGHGFFFFWGGGGVGVGLESI